LLTLFHPVLFLLADHDCFLDPHLLGDLCRCGHSEAFGEPNGSMRRYKFQSILSRSFAMPLLDQILGRVLGQQQPNAGTPSSGIGSVLMQLLAGEGSSSNQGGGVAGLIQQFRDAGLGHVADSWVSTGPNQPVSPQQLQRVFGDTQVETMARQSGLPPQSFLSQLSQHLPRVVDDMTPEGRLPDEGTVSV
jgi:uncharacterized protein YidB (DUF937 family)